MPPDNTHKCAVYTHRDEVYHGAHSNNVIIVLFGDVHFPHCGVTEPDF